ncbi:MAG: tRNA uridine-5-carboxymethylaminomethyl(34) synthesis GTPase MnmE [Porphyromonadaceae bacterium]|nr:tRNA uridine-5-carboxymethylaminomethyl(34) synthesis GTPase MnmE [Porphyromonadaceae bacterium]
MSDDTICALSTPPGVGGIAVIRISGKEAFTATETIFKPLGNSLPLSRRPSHTLAYGEIYGQDGAVLDQVVVSIFKAPHSYTGEDTVEISCHGSPYIVRKIIERLIESGCRVAAPGEFTRRAFAHGRMDLSQAEAVADLIASNSAAAHRIAMNQMRGGFSRELADLRGQLLKFVSLIELELDFGEEDVEFADRSQLVALSHHIEEKLTRLADSFSRGNAIKNGIPTIIIGETNVGKSTLLNRLLCEERALVSTIPGTTRDTIEEIVNLQGVAFRFIDTAGIRPTSDEVENMGIERTFAKLDQADIVLWMIDGTQSESSVRELAARIVPRCQEKQLFVLVNKCDLLSSEQISAMCRMLADMAISSEHILQISAKNNENIDKLEAALAALAYTPETQNDTVVTNVRHYEALVRAKESIHRVCQGLAENYSGDLLSQDIRETMHHLGEITGEITTDEILTSIFQNFCIGK